MRILVFDSGIGALGIVGALRRSLPDASIALLADNAAFPYGEKPDAWLVARIEAVIVAGIAQLRPDLVVIACNTASTLALDTLRTRLGHMPFVGVVPPIKWAAERSASRTIGLLATTATVRRGYLAALQARYAPDHVLLAHGARGLADLAEQRFRGGFEADPDRLRDAVCRELAGLFTQPGAAAIEAVAIGCTHYSLLLDVLAETAPRAGASGPILWLDPAEPVARHAAAIAAGLPPRQGGRSTDIALFTAPPEPGQAVRRGLAFHGFSDLSVMPVTAPDAVSAGLARRVAPA